MKQGERKEKKEARSKKSGANGEAEAEEEEAEPGLGNINPARLAMMNQPERPARNNHYRQRY